MKVLVTGGTGFLGRRLVRQLLSEGLAVRCLVRPSSDLAALRDFIGENQWARLDIVRGEMLNNNDCQRAVSDCDIVYHSAAALGGGCSTLFLNTVVPTRRLIDAALDANVGRFVLVSSIAVYGTNKLRNGANLTEDCPLESQPQLRDPYTFSKVVQEQVAWEAHKERELPLVVVRPGVIIGPARGAMSDRIGLGFAGWRIRIGGGQQLPYTYVDNCASGVMLAGLADNAIGHGFNLIDDNLPNGRKVLKAYRRIGQKVRSVGVPRWTMHTLSGCYEWYHRWSKGQLPGVITRYKSAALWKPLKYQNDKAKSVLGWQPFVTWEEAFQKSTAV